jgi:hypothetical protein
MTLVLSIFGVAFAALCVWLAVRIVNRKERWAKRLAAAIIVIPSLYALGIGPAGWLRSYDFISHDAELTFFHPVYLLMQYGPEEMRDVMLWWLNLWTE